jgi:hypothetical protein
MLAYRDNHEISLFVQHVNNEIVMVNSYLMWFTGIDSDI